MTDSPDPVQVGNNLTYTITVSNVDPTRSMTATMTCSETPLFASATTSSIVTADAVAGTQPRRTSISRNRRTLKSVQPPRQSIHVDLLAFLRVRLLSAQDTGSLGMDSRPHGLI